MTPAGFLVVDKPPGPTSHDVVASARRATGIKKIGHAGTLDPPARGVLVLALGAATRLIRYVQEMEKEYLAVVRFGIATSTLDAAGEELSRRPMVVTRPQLEHALENFIGEIDQVPPMVSALKVGGRRLHEMARRGEEIDREPRRVHIYQIDLEDLEEGEYPRARLRIRCGKGTYVRSLAADLGAALGGEAHVEELTRTRVGPFAVGQAMSDPTFDNWQAELLPPRVAVAAMDTKVVTGEGAVAVRHGRQLPSQGGTGPLAMLDEAGDLLAVYRREGTEARAEVVLP
jgi:tRNA pseudouridine55 synthase